MTPLKRDTDVVFLLDASEGVTPDVYDMQKKFIVSVATQFSISPTGPRAAVIMYDSFAYTIVPFGGANLKGKVEKALLIGLPRRMDEALEQAQRLFTRSSRDGRKIVILLTAGRQAVQPDVKPLGEAVKPLQNLGVQTFVVAIGLHPDNNEITPAVDERQDVFKVTIPQNLPSQAPRIARKIRDKPGNFVIRYDLISQMVPHIGSSFGL